MIDGHGIKPCPLYFAGISSGPALKFVILSLQPRQYRAVFFVGIIGLNMDTYRLLC